MKTVLSLLILGFLSFVSCTPSSTLKNSSNQENKMTFEADENGEYDIIVFDPQYDVFLKTHARPENFQSYEYYKSRNRMYVTIWNQRHMMPSIYDPNLYAVSIDLDPSIDYGNEFEFKLFQFFQFIEWKYRIRLM